MRHKGIGVDEAYVVAVHGNTLRPATDGENSRADAFQRTESHSPGLLTEISCRSGSVLQQGCTRPVVGSLVQHEPDTMARARSVLGCTNCVPMQLIGGAATDVSEAVVAPR